MSRGNKAVISKPQPLQFFSGDPAANWSTFKEEWDAYEEGSGLVECSSTERVITFLRVVGKDAINIYNSFSWPEETDSRNIDRVIDKFETLCLSDKSTRFQRYLFHKREQETGEKLDDYVSDVKTLAELCGFGDIKDMLICDKIVFGLKERLVKEEMLKCEEVQSENVVKLIKEKQDEFEKGQQEILKAADKATKLKRKNKGNARMADDQEMITLDEVGFEEPETVNEHAENGSAKDADDALIIKADSDIESIHDEETEEPAEKDEAEVPQTKRDTEFTSEDFKIELKGLPRYYAMGVLKKLLNETLQLKAHKIKPAGYNKDWAYVTFRDEKSRTKALAVLEEYQWKKCTLTAAIAKAVEDPVARRRDTRIIEGNDPDSKVPINDRVVKSVTPYAHRTYEDQLQEKQKAALSALRKFGNEMAKTNPELKEWVKFHKLRRKGQVCEVVDIVRSPVIDGYRNKCEFTVGFNPEDELPTVGFRVSSYKSGSLAVAPVQHLVHIPESMKKVVKLFQDYVRNSGHSPFSPLSHEGMWRQLTVRTSSNGDLLIAVVIHPQEFTEEQLGDIKQDVIDYFKDGNGSTAGVTSIFFQAFGQKEPGPEDVKYEHLWGEEYITETVLGKTFRISCESFFQVNTKACEVLYETIGTLAELDGTSVILDICCGTGTIGVSLADQCLKVYGIEMVKKAAEDARHNAALNGQENVAIYTGKAEVNMNAVLAQCVKYNTVGIVDPPRAGLSEGVVRALRKCDNMDRLIYMSCDPEGAFKNFIDLSRPKSKNYKGEFFVPIKAAVVDMFPHTAHYELLIVFERWEERKWRRIMEGNPLPRDEAYFKRLPAKPEGTIDPESDEDEPEVRNTGYGSWKSISNSAKWRDRESHQPYRNPRQEFADEDESYRGRTYDSGYEGQQSRGYEGQQSHGYEGQQSRGYEGQQSSMDRPPGNFMGSHPYEDRYGGGGVGGRSDAGPSPAFDRFYNEGPGRMYDRQGHDQQSYDRMPERRDFDRMPDRQASYSRPPTDPYRLSREDYDRPFFDRRHGSSGPLHDSPDSYRRDGRGFSRY